MPSNAIITLTTDFGLIDSYVAAMKGVILGIAPHAQLIDTTHSIRPQAIHQAAYMVQTFYSYFPPGTIHLVVVDPGVGSARRPIVLATPNAMFVAPDNGVLTYVWRDALARWGEESCTVVELTDPGYWLTSISSTFHGRDIFAPVAAHLANGIKSELLGKKHAAITEAALEQPTIGRQGELIGRIIHVDYFGNCVTNIDQAYLHGLGEADQLRIKVLDQSIYGLHSTYADQANGSLIALIGSSGRLEIAVTNGGAAQVLGVGIGDSVKVLRAIS